MFLGKWESRSIAKALGDMNDMGIFRREYILQYRVSHSIEISLSIYTSGYLVMVNE